jgi:hypothetical protein
MAKNIFFGCNRDVNRKSPLNDETWGEVLAQPFNQSEKRQRTANWCSNTSSLGKWSDASFDSNCALIKECVQAASNWFPINRLPIDCQQFKSHWNSRRSEEFNLPHPLDVLVFIDRWFINRLHNWSYKIWIDLRCCLEFEQTTRVENRAEVIYGEFIKWIWLSKWFVGVFFVAVDGILVTFEAIFVIEARIDEGLD